MRRSAIVVCLFAFIVLGSRPDAAFVPAPRTPDSAAARRIDPGRPPSASVARTANLLPPRVGAAPAFAAPMAVAMPAVPMQPPAGRTATTTALAVAPNPSSLTAPVTLTATVAVVPPASGTPTGLVRFRANGAVIGSAPVAPSGLAVFTTGFVVPGPLDLTASYVGDTTFAPSTSDPVPHLTSAAANSTLTAIVTSPTPSATGAAVTVLALVFPMGGGTPTGTVEFREGGTPIGTSSLVTFSGLQIAVTTITPATPGARTLTAHYAGDATFTGSVSPTTVHTVYTGTAPSVTTTALATAPASSLVGQAVTLTATVTRAAGGVATGTVDFYAGGGLLGSQTLAAGGGAAQAALTVSNLPKGISLLSAAYRGTSTSAASATFFPVFQCVDCTAANATPFADAGPIQAVAPGAVVQLDGSKSSDLEGAPLTYTWTPVSTSPFTPATLTNPTSARPTFVAAAVQTLYAFDLVVSDGTLSSPPARTYVIATASFVNVAPTANAGSDQFVTAGEGVTLSGSGSIDPDAQPSPLTYQWVMRSAPVGSTAELNDVTSATPSFYLDLEGRYEFELVVFDGATLSAADRVVVATNHPPVARAGEDQERPLGSTVYLSGAGSTDDDGQALTYTWTLVSRPIGSSAVLSSTTAVLPTFTVDQPGNYVARLVVHDGIDPSDPDTVSISTGDLAPVADPGPARFVPGGNPTSGALSDDRPVVTVGVGQTVHLDGTASSDPNFQFAAALTYAWTLVQRPAGSAAALAAPTSARPTFVADVAGVYVARLVVTSGALSSAPREIRIATGNSRPSADPGPGQTVATGAVVTLDGAGSTDPNGDTISYQWSFTTRPAGSAAVLSGDTTPRPSFVADAPGVYVAQLLVSDGAFVDAATVLVTTVNVAPIGRAGADQAVPPPSAVSLDGQASTDANFDPLTYRWVLIRKPAGSAAALSGATTAVPGFSVDLAGDYIAQLRVSDGERYGAIDTVVVTTANAAPLANAGADQNAAVGGLVSLDGTNSSDANGTALTYQWAILYRPAGSAAALSNPADAEPTFVADLPGTYVVQLVTSDGTLRSAADTVVVTTVGAPVAVAIAPDTAYTGASVSLDGSGSSDPQLLPLTYLWSFGSRPPGSVASIESPLAAVTAFTPDLAGTYVVCLVVSNGAVSSAADCETIEVTAAPALTLSPSVLHLALNETASMTVTLNQPAGPSGVTVSLVASGTAGVTVPPSVTVPAGLTSADFDVNAGPSDGTATISATADGFAGDLAHVNVSVSGISITLGAGLVVAPQQIRDLSLTLSEPAPAGGVLITLASSNPAVATVTPSIFVPEGADVPPGNPQVIGLAYGMTEISAIATGLAGDTEVVAVARSVSLSPSTLNVVTGGNGTLLLQASAPAPAGGLGFNVNAEAAGVIINPTTATIPANQLTTSIVVTGLTPGTRSITVTPTDSADSSTASATVNVTDAQPINLGSTIVGNSLQTWLSGSLGSPAPAGGRLITITSGDIDLVRLAANDENPGTEFIELFVPAGATQIPPFLVRGRATAGSVVLTATAAGLPDGTGIVTLAPSGFVFGVGNFVTGLFSPNITIPIHAVRLDPVTAMPVEPQQWQPGSQPKLGLIRSNPAVGLFTGITIDAARNFSTTFDPTGAGTTIVRVTWPGSTPAAGAEITITVAAPLTFSAPTLTVGRNLQTSAQLSLGSPAPAGNLPVVITSADPAKVLLSKTAAGAGSASISITVPAGSTGTPPFFVQALDESGVVSVTAAAANYEPASLAVTLAPSGVVFGTASFTTHPNAPNTTLTLATAWLETGTLEYAGLACERCQAVRAGYPSFDVTVTSSDNPTGSVPNPATFTAGNATATTAFDPHATGAVTLTITTPAGFSTPANGTQIDATVTPQTATLSAGGILIGKNLQTSNAVSLGEPAPAGNLLVTIQSSDPSRVLLSTTPTSPGMDTISITVPAGQAGSPTFYVHALEESGTVAVNLTAPGYVSGSFDVTLRPSGFVFRSGSFSTSTLSPDVSLEIRAVALEPGTLEYPVDPFCTRCGALRTGVTAEVVVTSAPTTVGTITISPVTIAPATGIGTTAFHPLSGGTATLSLGTPPGFSTPSTFREITATVGNPALTIGDLTIGKDLQAAASVGLGAPAEAGGASVTIVSADPGSVLLSTSPTAAGAASITLNVASGASQTPAFYVQALTATGAAQLSATASGYSPATGTVSLRPSGFVFVSGDFVTGALSPNTTVTLRSVWLDPVLLTFASDPSCTACQAVRGGISPVAVTVTSSDPVVGTMTGAAVFSGGDATASTAFDPHTNGTATLTIEAPDGFSASGNFSSIVATVQPALQPNGATVGRDLQAAAGGSITAPAPAGNLLVTLQSSDPSKLLLSASPMAAGQASLEVMVPAGSSGFGYFVQALVSSGSAQVLASAPGYTSGQATINFWPSGFVLHAGNFTVAPTAPNVPLTIRSVRIDPDFLNFISDPSCTSCQAVRPGIDVTVGATSSDAAVGTIVGSAQFTAGIDNAVVHFDPHAVGTTTVALGPAPSPFATPSNFQAIEVTVEVPPPSITVGAATVGKNLQVPASATLGAPAPAGNLDLTITSADPDKVLLSASPTTVGASSVTISVPAGSMTSPVFYIQALSDSGTVQLTSSAPGYLTGNAQVTLWPSGFVIETPSFTTSPTAVPHAIQVRSVRIDPMFHNYTPDPSCSSCQNVRAGLTVDVPVVSADTGIGTITLSPLAFIGNEGVKSTGFDGVSPGTVAVSLTAPDGFETPSNLQSIDATVTNSYIALTEQFVGKNLQVPVAGTLGEPAPAGNLVITITSADPAKLLLSNSSSAPGSPSITVSVPAGSTTVPAFYAQALHDSGVVALEASGPGFVGNPVNVTLSPSGFAFMTSWGWFTSTDDFSTTTSSPDRLIALRPVRLLPDTLAIPAQFPFCWACQPLRPGLTVGVIVTSSDTAVATINNSPITFDHTADSGLNAVFDPLTPGTTTVSIVQPAGFSQPSTHGTLLATVTAPPLTITQRAIGKNLQIGSTVALGAPAPPGNLVVTITSADPSKVLVSTNPATMGSDSITITVPAGSSTSPEFYVQALSDTGSVNLNVSAGGYANGGGQIDLQPGGFILTNTWWCPSCFLPETIQTTTGAPNTPLYVVAARLHPSTLNYVETQFVRGGFSVDVTVSTTPTGIGTIVPTPVNVSGGNGFESQVGSIAFDPASGGTTLLEVVTPPGFSQSSNLRQLTAIVAGAALSVLDQSIGKNLQVAATIALGEPAPAGGLDVTVTSADAAKVLVSADPSAQGSGSATVHADAGQTTVIVYVQALADAGTVGITASAPGRTNGTATMTLTPGAFVLTQAFNCIGCFGQAFTTTTGAANTQLYVVAGRLNAGTGDFETSQNVRGGLTVDVTVSSTSTVGTNVMAMVPTTVSFIGGIAFGSSVAGIAADPLNPGTSVLEVVTPSGFAASNTFRQITATVTGPTLFVGNAQIGKDLQTTLSAFLEEPAPAGGVDVSLQSADPSKVVVSAGFAVPGTSSATVHVPAGLTEAVFHVQSLASAGTVGLTASAPGFGQAVGNAALQPSGFVISRVLGCPGCQVSFDTTTGAANTVLYIVASRLTSGTLAFEADQSVRAGLNVIVTVQSADSTGVNVGTMTPSSVTFTGGGPGTSSYIVPTEFDPANAGVAIIEPLAPAGFSTPSTFRQMTANVTGPGIELSVDSVGKDLQTVGSGGLAEAAPPAGLAVTITSSDPARLRLAAGPTDLGTTSIVLTVPAGSFSLPAFYVQALDGSGSVDITATATGYATGTATVSLMPSGFVILSPGTDFTTTTLSSPVTMAIYSVRLAPSLAWAQAQPLRPGTTIEVRVTAADAIGSGVGTILGSPVTFSGNQGTQTVEFDPSSAGSSVITVEVPAGFSTPANSRVFTATVTAPSMFVGNALIGKDLQTVMSGSLQATSPGDVTFTITSSDPSKVLLATVPTAAGAASIAVTSPGPTAVIPGFHVYGLADTGTVTLTITAPNFVPTTAQVTLTPSGFIISSPGNFTTQGNAANTQFEIASARVAPGTLAYQVAQPLRGGASASVNVTSSAPAVGTMTVSPVTFTGNQQFGYTFFDPQPVAVEGTTTVQLSTPAGFSTPSEYQQVTATVQAVTLDGNATSNYAQWLLGAPSAPSVASFDSFATGSILSGGEYAATGLTIVQRDGHPMRIASPGDGSFLQAANLNSQPKGVTSSGVPANFDNSKSENYDFLFAHPVTSAGLWIGNLDPGFPAVTVQFLDASDAVIQSYDATAADPQLVQGPGGDSYNNRLFVGVNATVPIARIRVFNGANDDDGVVFDDVVFNRAATTVIDFEDQPDNFVKAAFPASYRGINWTNFLHYAPYPAQYQAGGINAIFGAVDGARFTFPEQLFAGADFRRSPGTTGAIYFELYRSGALVHTSAPFGTGSALAFLPSGYSGPVDEVRVRSLGDSMVALGAMWVMDNVSFLQTTAAGTLTLTPGSSSRALGSTDPMTVSIGSPLSFDLPVTLTSSEPSVASVPASVVISAGATSASFAVTAASNGGALINASSAAASPGKAVVAVGGNVVEWISNASGAWSQGANWSTGAPPGAADVVYIDRPGNITVFVDTVGAVRTLLASETVTVSSALTIANAAAFDRGLNLQAFLQGAGRASVRGASTWASGQVTLAGGLDIEAGQSLAIILGNDHIVNGAALRNRGRIVWNAGQLAVHNGANIVNEIGGLFDVQGDLQFTTNGNGLMRLTNHGVLRKLSGTGTFTFGPGGPWLENMPTGTIDIRSGTFAAATGSVFNSGHISVGAGAAVNLDAFTLNAGSTLSGAGMLFANGTTTINADITSPVALTLTAALGGPGRLRMNAPFTWNGGTVALAGGLDVEPGQTLTVTTGADHHLSASTLRNRGTVAWNGGMFFQSNGSVFDNQAGALFDVQGNLQLATNGNGLSPFHNTGTVRKSAGSGPFTIGPSTLQFNNNAGGTFEIQQGSFAAANSTLTSSGHIDVAAGATFQMDNVTLNTGATFGGAGTLSANGTTTVNGTITVPAALTITGSLAGTGRLITTGPSTWTSGTISLAGGLDVEADAVMSVSGGADHILSFTVLRNRGQVLWSGGVLFLSNGSTFQNQAGAVFEVQGNLQLASNGNGTSPFTNDGIVRKTAGTGAFTVGPSTVAFTNNAGGTVEIQAGSFTTANSSFSTSGAISLAAGTTFSVNEGTLNTGATFGGAGTLLANGNTTVTGDVTVGAALTLSGSLNGSGRLRMAAPLTWNIGTVALGGGLDIQPGQTFAITGGGDHHVSFSSVRNAGTATWTSGLLHLNNGSTVFNESAGVWQIDGNVQMASNGNGISTFTNNGLLKMLGAARTLHVGPGGVRFANGESGILQLRLGPTAAQFDRITSSEHALLNGQIDIQLIGGFTPAVTDVFTLLSFASRTGTFALLNGNGHAWTPCYTNTSFIVGDPANGAFCAGP